MIINKKINLEFDKVPKLVFVSPDGMQAELYIDGELVKGAMSVTIRAEAAGAVTHEIEYATRASGK